MRGNEHYPAYRDTVRALNSDMVPDDEYELLAARDAVDRLLAPFGYTPTPQNRRSGSHRESGRFFTLGQNMEDPAT
jgi:hypothetical protein